MRSGPFAGIAPRFDRRVVTIGPGGIRAYDESEWRDAIVVVGHGQIALEDVRGDRWPFARGAMVWLHGLPLSAIHNPGHELAVLIAFRRRT
jgi:hypothetical protein